MRPSTQIAVACLVTGSIVSLYRPNSPQSNAPSSKTDKVGRPARPAFAFNGYDPAKRSPPRLAVTKWHKRSLVRERSRDQTAAELFLVLPALAELNLELDSHWTSVVGPIFSYNPANGCSLAQATYMGEGHHLDLERFECASDQSAGRVFAEGQNSRGTISGDGSRYEESYTVHIIKPYERSFSDDTWQAQAAVFKWVGTTLLKATVDAPLGTIAPNKDRASAATRAALNEAQRGLAQLAAKASATPPSASTGGNFFH